MASGLNLPTATLAQLQQYANQQAAAQTAAAAAPLTAQQQATDQQYAQHGAAIQGFSQALAQLLGQLAPKVQDAYTQAANSQATFGKGFSDAIQNQIGNSSQANANFLQQMGAPAGAARPTPDVGSVAYGLGGYIPASTMNREGAAFGAAANLLPGDALLRGQQDFTSNLNQQGAADAKIQQQIADLVSKQPATAFDLLTKLQGMQTKAVSTAATAKRDAFNQWAKTQSLNQSAQRLTNQQAKQSFDQWATQQGLKIRWANLSLSERRQAVAAAKSNTQVITAGDGTKWTFDKTTGALTQLPIPGKPPKPQFSAKQVSDFKNKAASWAKLAWEGQYDPKTKAWVSQPQTYQAALQTLTDHGIPMYIAQLSLKRYWTKPGFEADPQARAEATQHGKPITPAWVKSDTGPIYARGQGAKVNAAGKALAAQGAATTDPKAATVINLAVQALGTPYVWGGSRPGGFDCSGLLYYVWGKAGVNIPRTTYDQFSAGSPVPLNQLQPGDAVFFKGGDAIVRGGILLPGHVAMYVGDGKIIEAYGRGVPVRVTSLAGRNDIMGARRFG